MGIVTLMFQKKSLGQNFLRSERALREIIDVSNITQDDTIVEIGPGEGVLTHEILSKKPKKLISIEKDDRLIPILTERFNTEIASGKFELVHKDVIDVLNEPLPQVAPFKVIANIPYYITGLIIRKLFELEVQPKQIVLLVQKEVADRLTDAKKNNLLRASVTLYGEVRRVSVVPRGAFVPAPTVDSAIISITNIHKPGSVEFEKVFFEVVKSAFSHKRKRVLSNLKATLGVSQDAWVHIFADLGINAQARPEDISTDLYIEISKKIISL